MHSKRGFTLAEVLIVITIIGIIAMQTIPTLIQNIKNQETIAKYKKTYSILSQAAAQIKEEDFGGGKFQGPNMTILSEYWKNLFKKYLIYAKEYSTTTVNYKIVGDSGTGLIKALNQPLVATTSGWGHTSNSKAPALILNDGTILLFSGYELPSEDIIVDFNGNKPPNTMGLDVFIFYLNDNYSQKLEPSFEATDGPCDKGIANYGYNCGTAILTGNYNP